jgi:hypothetical protein
METASMNDQERAQHLMHELRLYDMEHQTDSASSLDDPDGAPLLAPILERLLAEWGREHMLSQACVQTLVRRKRS